MVPILDSWPAGEVQALPLGMIGERYRRYRLASPEAEEEMIRSFRRWGQLAPITVCVREGVAEVLDGFKRLSAARRTAGMQTLAAQSLEVDERGAKAAIYGLNQVGKHLVSDVHLHRTTNQRPRDRHAEERPYLIPLPARAFDPSPVVYRVVDAEGLVAWHGNRYSVPWRYIGQTLPVRITEAELVVYSPQVEEVGRHPLFPAGQTGQLSVQAEHRPCRDGTERLEMLRERFARLGEGAIRFLDGLLSSRRYGKDEAQKVLALLGTYAQTDLMRAMERAVRYRAFSLRAVERILAVMARPKGLLEMLADEARERLGQLHPDPPVPPRPTSDYQSLLEEPADGKVPDIEQQASEEPADQDQRGECDSGGHA